MEVKSYKTSASLAIKINLGTLGVANRMKMIWGDLTIFMEFIELRVRTVGIRSHMILTGFKLFIMKVNKSKTRRNGFELAPGTHKYH